VKARAKGTAAETLVVRYLQSTYWPFAERRALAGGQDKGDITGTPGLAWEVKSAKTLCVPAWLRETEAERVNAKADYATLVIKPTGVGGTRVGEFYALMDREKFRALRDCVLDLPSCPESLLANRYTFGTSIRKMNISTASANLHFHSLHHPWGWAHYPEFALTSLRCMTDLLLLAGYGSNNN
jgi:hypothetical protein